MFKTTVARISWAMEKGMIFFIRSYRYWISPMLGSRCRFYPSCSGYAQIAINRFGVLKGIVLTIQRMSRCHPWHQGGVDLVPPKVKESA
jgi:hypothetical protein